MDSLEALGVLSEPASVHLDRAYDSNVARRLLEERGLDPLETTKRWVVERTNSCQNAYKKLLWCTEHRGRIIDQEAHPRSLASLSLGR